MRCAFLAELHSVGFVFCFNVHTLTRTHITQRLTCNCCVSNYSKDTSQHFVCTHTQQAFIQNTWQGHGFLATTHLQWADNWMDGSLVQWLPWLGNHVCIFHYGFNHILLTNCVWTPEHSCTPNTSLHQSLFPTSLGFLHHGTQERLPH